MQPCITREERNHMFKQFTKLAVVTGLFFSTAVFSNISVLAEGDNPDETPAEVLEELTEEEAQEEVAADPAEESDEAIDETVSENAEVSEVPAETVSEQEEIPAEVPEESVEEAAEAPAELPEVSEEAVATPAEVVEEPAAEEAASEEPAAEVIEETEETDSLLQAGTGSISGKVVYNSGADAKFDFDVTLHLFDTKPSTEYTYVLKKGTNTFEFKGIPDGQYFVYAQFGTKRDNAIIGMGPDGKKAVIKDGNSVTGYIAYANWTYDMWARGSEEDLIINKHGMGPFFVVTSGNTMELLKVNVMDMKFNVVATTKPVRIDIDGDGLQYVYLDPAPVRSLPPGKYQFMLEFKSGGSFKDFQLNNETVPYDMEFVQNGDKFYWFEHGMKQGTYDDPQGVMGDGTIRGREIFDPASDGWYWLDSVYDGAKATGKEVWMPYIYQQEDKWTDAEKAKVAYESDPGMGECVLNAIKKKDGKWVRYDENGKMLKGWVTIAGALATLYPSQAGNTYYYDTRTGLMAKGWVTIDGVQHHFDEITGKMLS